jgi:hypothetical protein
VGRSAGNNADEHHKPFLILLRSDPEATIRLGVGRRQGPSGAGRSNRYDRSLPIGARAPRFRRLRRLRHRHRRSRRRPTRRTNRCIRHRPGCR